MVSIKNQLIRTSAISALGVTAMACFIAPAMAAQGTSGGMHLTVVSARVAASEPNTNITGSPAKWNPTELTSTGKCFTITNKEAKAETVLYNTGRRKQPLATLAAHSSGAVCGSIPKGVEFKFYIKGSKSVLTVTAG